MTPGIPVFLTKGKLEEFSQTLYSTLAELAQQFPVIEKESAQDYGNGENILTVGNRIEINTATSKIIIFPTQLRYIASYCIRYSAHPSS